MWGGCGAIHRLADDLSQRPILCLAGCQDWEDDCHNCSGAPQQEHGTASGQRPPHEIPIRQKGAVGENGAAKVYAVEQSSSAAGHPNGAPTGWSCTQIPPPVVARLIGQFAVRCVRHH